MYTRTNYVTVQAVPTTVFRVFSAHVLLGLPIISLLLLLLVGFELRQVHGFCHIIAFIYSVHYFV
jgi:hypothetical protein